MGGFAPVGGGGGCRVARGAAGEKAAATADRGQLVLQISASGGGENPSGPPEVTDWC